MRKSLIIIGLFGTAFTLATAAFGCEYGSSKALNVEKAGAKNLPIEKSPWQRCHAEREEPAVGALVLIFAAIAVALAFGPVGLLWLALVAVGLAITARLIGGLWPPAVRIARLG